MEPFFGFKIQRNIQLKFILKVFYSTKNSGGSLDFWAFCINTFSRQISFMFKVVSCFCCVYVTKRAVSWNRQRRFSIYLTRASVKLGYGHMKIRNVSPVADFSFVFAELTFQTPVFLSLRTYLIWVVNIVNIWSPDSAKPTLALE